MEPVDLRESLLTESEYSSERRRKKDINLLDVVVFTLAAIKFVVIIFYTDLMETKPSFVISFSL